MNGASFQPGRPRTFKHPGRPNPVRIQSENSREARHVRLALQPGSSLFDAMVNSLARIGIENASFTILGGVFENLDYCVAPPDPKKHSVIAYTKPIKAGKTYMVFGNATLGESMEGQPLVHCHAVILGEDGKIRGGHILTESCIIGAKPISALVTSLEGFKLVQSFDAETNIPLLQPVREQKNG